MICPKCGFEQPESPECARCGIIVGRYKGPVFGGTATPVATPAPMSAPVPAPAAASAVGTVFGDPAPAVAGGGTLYGGPAPAAAGGGTVYQGPGSQPHLGKASGPVLTIIHKLRFGEVLSQAFTVYAKNFIPFTILTAIAFSPIYLFGDYLLRRYSENENPMAAAGVAMIVALAALLLCVPLSTSMITYGVFQEMRGRSSSLGECLSVGLSSLLPVISVAFLQAAFVGLVTLGTVVIVSFTAGLLGAGAAARGAGGAACSIMLMPLLLLVFIFPLMVWLRYFVAVPAAVEERPGALEAMRRSVFLTEGQRGRIFGIVLVLGILNIGVQLATSRIPSAGPLLEPLLGLVTSSLFATTCAVIYYRLRSFHESIDVDQIASVFD
jgi:hypothetical protein